MSADGGLGRIEDRDAVVNDGGVELHTAAERFDYALRVFRAMSESDIEALLARKPHEHNRLSWMVLGIVALDQGDIDPRKVVIR